MLKYYRIRAAFIFFSSCFFIQCSLFVDYEDLDCDYELDLSCEDLKKGQIYGQIFLPKTISSKDAQIIPTLSLNATVSDTDISNSADEDSSHHSVTYPQKQWFLGEYVIAINSDFNLQKFNKKVKEALPEHAFEDVVCGSNQFCLLKMKYPTEDSKNIFHNLKSINLKSLRFIERNLKFHMNKVPNDEFYNFQWNLDVLRMPIAWEVTTGGEGIVTAVIDTGIVSRHIDLDSRILAGADLISDENSSNDGDGIDSDAEDAGDNSCGSGCHSFHGTHVAGIIAAKSNNITQITGITWKGYILPIRVLGQEGGSLYDIAQGILWSVGEKISELNTNQNPADVINLSLGAEGHSKIMDEAIATAVDKGAIVVVAAGNENSDASAYTPANSPKTIVVAAVDKKNPTEDKYLRAEYSNYGDTVDIVAPGGDIRYDRDSDGHPDAILSTHGNYLNILQGTSMAAPQVAGIVALLKDLKPDIEQVEVEELLKKTANPKVHCPLKCGAGLIDAAKVLLFHDERRNQPWPVLSRSNIHLGYGYNTAIFQIDNIGLKKAVLSLEILSGERDKVILESDSILINTDNDKQDFELEADTSKKFKLKIARNETFSDSGSVKIKLSFQDANEKFKQNLSVRWDDSFMLFNKGVLVAALRKEDSFFSIERATIVTAVDDYHFKLHNLRAGDYKIIALYDDDGDGQYETGEGGGVWGDIGSNKLLHIEAKDEIKNINFFVSPQFKL